MWQRSLNIIINWMTVRPLIKSFVNNFFVTVHVCIKLWLIGHALLVCCACSASNCFNGFQKVMRICHICLTRKLITFKMGFPYSLSKLSDFIWIQIQLILTLQHILALLYTSIYVLSFMHFNSYFYFYGWAYLYIISL